MTDKILHIIYSGLVLMVLGACTDNELSTGNTAPAGNVSIAFHASVYNGEKMQPGSVTTRSGSVVEGEYVTMTSDVWGNHPVSIRHRNLTNTALPIGEEWYTVKYGVQGELDIDESKKWYWEVGNNSSHIFQAWTEPNPTDQEMTAGALQVIKDDPGNEGVKIIDFNAGNKVVENGNSLAGFYLNYLIGTSAGPVDYQSNGLYVPLYFKRLVSRIRITSIMRTYPDGTMKPEYNVWDIEFPDMPKIGRLQTHLADMRTWTAGQPVPAPEVVTDIANDNEKGLYIEYQGDKMITAISAVNGDAVPIYVPPFDFTRSGKFHIGYLGTSTPGSGDPTYRSYAADLGKVFLDRDEYRQQLLAGESMDIMLELKDDEVSGMYVYLHPWSDADNQDVMQRPSPGVYTADDFSRLFQALAAGQPVPEYLYEVDADGNKVIRLYGNINIPASWGELNLVIPDGYILDGMGYNIASNAALNFTGDCRDLKVNGKYIDKP